MSYRIANLKLQFNSNPNIFVLLNSEFGIEGSNSNFSWSQRTCGPNCRPHLNSTFPYANHVRLTWTSLAGWRKAVRWPNLVEWREPFLLNVRFLMFWALKRFMYDVKYSWAYSGPSPQRPILNWCPNPIIINTHISCRSTSISTKKLDLSHIDLIIVLVTIF